MIRAVMFDVGECLVDETREYGTWADWLGVPRHTFAATFGAVIARGQDYRETFQVFRPGFDLSEERERRAAAGQPESYGEDDLYPDVRPALAALRAAGLWLGIAGNQTVRSGRILRELFTPDVDLIATSDDWGVSKPDPAFFRRAVDTAPVDARELLYVGDRLDNDVLPAAAAGMRTALIRRGPWGVIQQHNPATSRATMRIDGLHELPERIAKFNAETAH
ncbi:HAD family hydrolase [Streptomyces sp. RFCAC02]|uniref:HAD family hydrolase n=1 Tax=Streptomyces sp. RFCAC02 TaxID=2499143 RepID=UPI0010214746|nr:HAD family hydrolase [Streptomyces sp. RFCAC02]